jgi:hypothetical protein
MVGMALMLRCRRISLKPGFSGKTPMLEANGGDFPSDPEALLNDWLGADLCVAAIAPESADHSRSRRRLMAARTGLDPKQTLCFARRE